MISIPGILRTLHDDVDEASYSTHFNMLICMVTSPMLFIGAIASFIARVFFIGEQLLIPAVDSAALLMLGACFEVFLRTLLKVHPKAVHIISLMYAAVFIFIATRFYYLIGPSVWVLGLVQVLFSMAQNSAVMLRYIMASMLLAIIHLLLNAAGQGYELLYNVMLIWFFILTAIVALIVFRVISIRNRKITAQYKKIMFEMQERKKTQKENIQLSYYDRLTGLANMTLCKERLGHVLHQAKRSGDKVYVFFLDIDTFKLINDTIGHNGGDAFLKVASERLCERLGANDFAARIGGDEFVAVIKGLKDKMGAVNLAGSILRAINEPFVFDGRNFTFTCSIGVSGFPFDGGDSETLIKCAEIAMYKAKEEGKNCFKVYSEDLKQVVETEMELISDMRDALANNEFVLHYQPQIDSVAKKVIGFEALIRWNHPRRGMLSPGEFIGAAEKSGLIVPIGEWVIRQACAQNKAWQNEDFAHVPVSVNVSSKQIYDDSIVRRLSQILSETGLNARFLELEITERILIKDIDITKEILQNIKQLGIKITIDDFGTGYSSIYYLKQLPINKIKLPMEFVHGIGKNAKDESIISVILGLADSLGMEVIAEGVETKKQLGFLNRNLCRGIQGFYFSRPLDAAMIKDYCVSNYKDTANISDYRAAYKLNSEEDGAVSAINI